MRSIGNITGLEVGRLKALRCLDSKFTSSSYYECQCSCGNLTNVTGAQLVRKRATVSCGCIAREIASARLLTHGMSHSTEFVSWDRMKARCYNANCPGYEKYGARGILMCDRWRNSFQNFFDDMGFKPTPEHTVDRIDNSKGYSPENCRWATKREQTHNSSQVKYLTFGGKTMVIMDWARELKMDRTTLGKRLSSGWSVEEALTTPVRGRNSK